MWQLMVMNDSCPICSKTVPDLTLAVNLGYGLSRSIDFSAEIDFYCILNYELLSCGSLQRTLNLFSKKLPLVATIFLLAISSHQRNKFLNILRMQEALYITEKKILSIQHFIWDLSTIRNTWLFCNISRLEQNFLYLETLTSDLLEKWWDWSLQRCRQTEHWTLEKATTKKEWSE